MAGAGGGCNGPQRQGTGPQWPGLPSALDGWRLAVRLGSRFTTGPQFKRSPHPAARWPHRPGAERATVRQSRKSRPINLPGSASEDQFHLAVAELLDWCLIPPTFYTTFPAGYGKLGKGMAGKLKAKGMKPGMPDILIFHKAEQFKYTRVVGLELKVKGNTASAKQRETHAALFAVGVRVYLIFCLNDVIRALHEASIPYRNITIPVGKTEVEVIKPSQTSLFEFSPYRGSP
ncbi:MAG TPA: hypothetical protein VGJ20_20465 [Xanthobacteraceae bacterium]